MAMTCVQGPTRCEHWDMDTSKMVNAYRRTQGTAGELPTQGEHEKFGIAK